MDTRVLLSPRGVQQRENQKENGLSVYADFKMKREGKAAKRWLAITSTLKHQRKNKPNDLLSITEFFDRKSKKESSCAGSRRERNAAVKLTRTRVVLVAWGAAFLFWRARLKPRQVPFLTISGVLDPRTPFPAEISGPRHA